MVMPDVKKGLHIKYAVLFINHHDLVYFVAPQSRPFLDFVPKGLQHFPIGQATRNSNGIGDHDP